MFFWAVTEKRVSKEPGYTTNRGIRIDTEVGMADIGIGEVPETVSYKKSAAV